MAPRRRARLAVGGTGTQRPLDGLVDQGPRTETPTEPPPELSEMSADARLNERRAAWWLERRRFERARDAKAAEKPSPTDGTV
jgi:hypothetical protein